MKTFVFCVRLLAFIGAAALMCGIVARGGDTASTVEEARATVAKCSAAGVECSVTVKQVTSIGWWIQDGKPMLPEVTETVVKTVPRPVVVVPQVIYPPVYRGIPIRQAAPPVRRR